MSAAVLELQHLSLSFGGIRAVRDVSMSVACGEVCALIGPNGAGKTSLFNLISGLYRPSQGRVLLDGVEISRRAPHEIAALGIARSFQNIELVEEADVFENLLMGLHCRRQSSWWQDLLSLPPSRRAERRLRAEVEAMLVRLDLQAHRHTPVGNLAYGVRKVVELARALLMQPRVLLLDEPSAGLSAEETRRMGKWIRRIVAATPMAILIVEHDMSLVSQVADRVVALLQGEVLTMGAPAAVLAHPALIEAYLGEDFEGCEDGA